VIGDEWREPWWMSEEASDANVPEGDMRTAEEKAEDDEANADPHHCCGGYSQWCSCTQPNFSMSVSTWGYSFWQFTEA